MFPEKINPWNKDRMLFIYLLYLSWYLQRTQSMPGNTLSAPQTLNHLIIVTTLQFRFCYPYFTDEETNTERLNNLTKITEQSLVINTGNMVPESREEYLGITNIMAETEKILKRLKYIVEAIF